MEKKEPSLPVKGRVKPLNAKTLAALPSMLQVTKDNIEYLQDSAKHGHHSETLKQRQEELLAKLIRSYEWLESVINAHV